VTSRELERAALAEIRALPADGSFRERSLEDPLYRHVRAPCRAWVSRNFVVQLFDFEECPRLSIQRSGCSALIRERNRDVRPISWDDLMEVKAAVGYGDAWAVEVYPPESEVVDEPAHTRIVVRTLTDARQR
jgi:hypothetical protein